MDLLQTRPGTFAHRWMIKTNRFEDPKSSGHLEVFQSHGPLLCMKELRHIASPLGYLSFLYSQHVGPREVNDCGACELDPVQWQRYL